MVATRNFFDEAFAFFTFLNVRSIFPIFYLIFKNSVATRPRMGLPIAFVAYLSFAFGTSCDLVVLVNNYDDRAFGIGTPFQIRIFLNFRISNKNLVFIEGRIVNKLGDDINRESNSTVRTMNFFDSHIIYLNFKA